MLDFEYKKQNLMQAISLRKEKVKNVTTKGRFIDNVAQAPPTNFNRDIEWLNKANPIASKLQ